MAMSLDDYAVVLYRNQSAGWVAEVPSVSRCHALMPTRETALAELAAVFQMILEEYSERNTRSPHSASKLPLPPG